MEKREYKNIIILFFLLAMLILVPTGFNLFGSDTDWLNQHIVFPEYFRQQFYDTGNLIPNFSLNYGAGQNIFNFAYYGLLSPIILLSYLFPFIEMRYYIIGTNIIILFVSVFLFYKWMRNNKLNDKQSLLVSIIFITSGPIVFHMHRHIMFVNYTPFLLCGLIGVDSYVNKNKKILLILSVFLMIMTSFYYSVGGIIVLLCYFIFKKIKVRKKMEFKLFIKELLLFIFYILVAVLMSAIIILPIFNTLLTARDIKNYNILEFLIPNVNPTKILYGGYSLGLSCIGFISILWFIFCNKKNYRFLGIFLSIIFFIPLFTFILNGGLYLRAKVFIPFIPLVCMIIGFFLKNLFENKINIKKFITFLFITNILVIISKTDSILYYIDFISMIIILVLYEKYKNKKIIYIPIVLISLFTGFYMNFTEDYVSYEEYEQIFDDKVNILLDNVEEGFRVVNLVNSNYTVNKIYNSSYYTTNIYSSTYNNYYYDFVRNEFKISNPYYNSFLIGSINNVLFNNYMGNKYIISKTNPGNNYEKVSSVNDLVLYKNDDSYSIGYVNSNLISNSYYETLTYPHNVEALLSNTVVEKEISNVISTNIDKVDLKYSSVMSGIEVNKQNDSYQINVQKKGYLKMTLSETLKNKILFINLNGLKSNDCTQKEISITINGIKNSLTCDEWIYPNNNETFHYVISESELNELTIEFSKGFFNIESIDLYTLDYENIVKNYDRFIIDNKKTNDNVIEGNISVTNDGYFNLTIPYDEGFEIYVDGTLIDYELVNKAFIGFPISSGTHNIKIVYNSPLLKEGKIVSVIGIIMFLGIVGKEVEKRKLLKLKEE